MTEIHALFCRNTEEIVCPYCGREHGDSWDMIDAKNCNQEIVECEDCEKKFLVETEYYISYSSSKADCLNGGEQAKQ